MLEKFALLTMYDDFKRAVYRKKSNGSFYTGLERTSYKFHFSKILGKSVLSEYTESTLTAKKSTEIKHLMINYRTIRKKF